MKLLATLLGAGSGLFGSAIRTGLAGLGGYLVAHGIEATQAAEVTTWIGSGVTIGLALLGSWLNNKAK